MRHYDFDFKIPIKRGVGVRISDRSRVRVASEALVGEGLVAFEAQSGPILLGGKARWHD